MKKIASTFILTISLVLCGCNSAGKKASSDLINIEIYGTNDLHGQILEEDTCPGFGKLATFLKERKAEENTLVIDQGDSWQGSIYSNSNRGNLITDLMNYIHYDARCIGNHDFDWGVEPLIANNKRSYEGYTTPVLAGNVYDFDFTSKIEGNVQQSEIGGKSITLDVAGLKVGILGGIGKDQITSINSLYTKDIAFKDHLAFIRDEASHLKKDENCDIVICSIHTGQESVMGYALNTNVDLFLCGHTHKQEMGREGNTYYVQCKGYEQSFSHITLTYKKSTKAITNTKVSYLTKNDINAKVKSIDSKVQSIIDSYNVDALAGTIYASNVSGSFDTEESSNMMANAIANQALAEGHEDIVCSLVNDARQPLPNKTSWTYADIFESFPFDNIVYIASVKGSELQSRLKYGYISRNPLYTNDTIDRSAYYKIAVIDYVYFHTNSERYYNYFPLTGGTATVTLEKNYREILIDWMQACNYTTGTELSSNQFTFSNWKHDRNAFSFLYS